MKRIKSRWMESGKREETLWFEWTHIRNRRQYYHVFIILSYQFLCHFRFLVFFSFFVSLFSFARFRFPLFHVRQSIAQVFFLYLVGVFPFLILCITPFHGISTCNNEPSFIFYHVIFVMEFSFHCLFSLVFALLEESKKRYEISGNQCQYMGNKQL